MNIIHFKPDELFAPPSPESREVQSERELEFVIDPATKKIAKIGDPRDVREWLAAKKFAQPDLIVDVEQGGVALPGFIDTHNHLLYGTLDVIDPGSASAKSFGEMKISVTSQAKQGDRNIPKVFLDHNTANVPEVFRDQLDEMSPKRPICLLDGSFHGARCNSSMVGLMKAAIAAEAKAGRPISSGEFNEKTGQATESYALLAVQIVESHYGIEKMAEGMKNRMNQWIGQGITDIHEMFPMSWGDLSAMLLARRDWEKQEKTEFPVRQIFMTPVLTEQLLKRQKELEKAGLFNPEKDWKMFGLKLMADGSFGSHTALMETPYGDTGGKGIEYHSTVEINKAIALAKEFGINGVAMHAIGDAGIQRALETAKKWQAMAEKVKLDPQRFRIEHFELSGNKLAETAKLGVWVSSQPNFLTDFVYEDRLSGRVTQICPHAEIVNNNIPMMFGSDGMPTSALFGMWAATHHPDPRQRIPFSQAMAAYSLAGADWEHEHGRGRIQEGASADVVILNKKALNDMLSGEVGSAEFKKLGGDSVALNDKVASLEAGIQKIYRQGQLVEQKK